jgi:hypothetical protein
VKFAKYSYYSWTWIFYPQIEIGKLLPLGKIDPESRHWQKLPDFSTISDSLFSFLIESNDEVFCDFGEHKVEDGFVLTGKIHKQNYL